MRKGLYSNLKKALLVTLLFCGSKALAKTPLYQITSTVGGFVAPQMSQAQRTAITATSLKGTLVYQTDLVEGYYYYDGAVWKLVNSATGLTGITPVANGGTGIANIPANNLIYGNGTSPVGVLAPSATTGTLLMNTAASTPGWSTLTALPASSGILPIANGGTNTSTIGAAGTVIYSTGTQQASTAVGTTGQFLTSNGAGAPTFGLLGQSATSVFTSTFGGFIFNSVATPAGSFFNIPGLVQNITVPANATVLVASDGGVLADLGGGTSFIDIAITVDGAFTVNGCYQRLAVPSNAFGYWNLNQALPTLTAGAHTIRIIIGYSSGIGAIVTGDNSSVLQATLTVSILKK